MAADDDLELCPVCSKLVTYEDNGMQCDAFCNKWHHAACVKVNVRTYKKIVELKDNVKWICSDCTGRLSNIRDQEVMDENGTNIHDLVRNLISVVKDIVNDNVSIKMKLDNIIQDKNRLCNSTDCNHIDVTQTDIPITSDQHSCDQMETLDLPIKQTKNSVSTDEMSSSCLTEIKDADFPELNVNMWQSVKSRKNTRQAGFAAKANSHRAIVPDSYEPNVNSNKIGYRPTQSEHEIVNKRRIANSANSEPNKLTHRRRPIVVGTCESAGNIVAGVKRAWFYLGRVKCGTNVDDIKNLLTTKLPGINPTVEKLESKGINDSFKISVEFNRKDELMNGSIWPKNVIVKRFLFKITRTKPTG